MMMDYKWEGEWLRKGTMELSGGTKIALIWTMVTEMHTYGKKKIKPYNYDFSILL